MSRTIITIALLFCVLATVSAKVIEPATSSDDVLQLAYNPTYDLWFFLPSGRPKNLNDTIKAAYWENRSGGVCFRPDNDWFYCKSGEKIQ